MNLFAFFILSIFGHAFSEASEIHANQAAALCQELLTSQETLIAETSRLRVLERGSYISVLLKDSGIRVGGMTADLNSWGRFSAVSTELAFRGQGYATEARLAVFEYAFTTKGTPKIVAPVSSANLASLHLHQKLGFEGVEVFGKFELVLTRERFFALKEWILHHFGSIDAYVQSHGVLPAIREKDFDQHFLNRFLGGVRPNYPIYQFSAVDLSRPPGAIE